MPRELAAARDLPARTDKRGVQHPLDTWYQVRVAFDEQPAHVVARVHGRAKISVVPQSLRAARAISQADVQPLEPLSKNARDGGQSHFALSPRSKMGLSPSSILETGSGGGTPNDQGRM